MAKIAGVEVPTVIDVFSRNHTDLTRDMWLAVDLAKHGFDSKGNYLHWHDFVPRANDFKGNKEFAYNVLRLKRSLKPHGNLTDEKFSPFYYTDNALSAKIHEIEKKATLEHLRIGATASEKSLHLAISMAMEEAISSAQLEGAATTRKVAKEMLETQRPPKNKSEMMILNNWHLLQFAAKNKDEQLTPDFICSLNQIATEGTNDNGHIAGEFRNDIVSVDDVRTGETVHQAPEHTAIKKMIDDICIYANTDHSTGGEFIHPIIKACVLHFMIGYVHPFFDGNGRTARSLFYWYMLKSGYENIRYLSISALLKEAPSQYVKSYVYTETDSNDLTHFIDYQLSIIIRALDSFSKYILAKKKELDNAIDTLKNSPIYSKLNLAHITILEKGIKDPGRIFTVKEIEGDFNVSSTTARGYLDFLCEVGGKGLLLKTTLVGKTKGYIAPRDLRTRLAVEQ